MYASILVPLDGSQRAEKILPHVAEMAKRCGAEVILLKVDESELMLGRDEAVDIHRYLDCCDANVLTTGFGKHGAVAYNACCR